MLPNWHYLANRKRFVFHHDQYPPFLSSLRPGHEILSSGHNFMTPNSDEVRCNSIHFGYLVVRRDLGELSDTDKNLILEQMASFISSNVFYSSIGNAIEDMRLEEQLPLFCRYSDSDILQLLERFKKNHSHVCLFVFTTFQYVDVITTIEVHPEGMGHNSRG